MIYWVLVVAIVAGIIAACALTDRIERLEEDVRTIKARRRR